MNCEKCLELLKLFSRGKLTEDKMPAIRKHVDGCSNCRRQYAGVTSRLSSAGRSGAGAAPGAKSNRPLILAGAAGAVVLIIVVVLALSRGGPAVPGGQPTFISGTGEQPGETEPKPAEPTWSRAGPVLFKARDELRKAVAFDSQYSGSKHGERMARYAAVFNAHPSSMFAGHAREKHDKINTRVEREASAVISTAAREKNFDAKLRILEGFLEKFEGTGSAERVQGKIKDTKREVARKFESDMQKCDLLVSEDRFDDAEELLDHILEYATQELRLRAAREKELVASLKRDAGEGRAGGVTQKLYTDLAKAVHPHMKEFNFEKALLLCNSRLSAAPGRNVRSVITAERRDINLLLNMKKKFSKRLSEAAEKREEIELESRDGGDIRGTIKEAGGTFVMDNRYVINMNKLSIAQIMDLGGFGNELARLKQEMLLLTCASDVTQAENLLRVVRDAGLGAKEVEWYEMKLGVLKEISAPLADAEPPREAATKKQATKRWEPAPRETERPGSSTTRKEKKKGEVQKLFNGRNLSGFNADQYIFKVEKGHICANHEVKGSPAYLFWGTPVEEDFTFSVKLLIIMKRGKNTSMGGATPIGAGIIFGPESSKTRRYRFWTDAEFGEKGWVGFAGAYSMKKAGSDWIEMKVVVKNNHAKTYFNGKEVASQNVTFKGGKVGVFAHYCNARFKEFKLQEMVAAGKVEKSTGAPTPEPDAEKEDVSPREDQDARRELERQRKEKLANYEKHLFKGTVIRRGKTVKATYAFQSADQLQDWLFAPDITKPFERTTDPGIWDVVESNRLLSGGGKKPVFFKAEFTGDATFEVLCKMRNAKNLVLMVSCPDRKQASAACFAVDKDTEIFVDETVKKQLAMGYRNLGYKLSGGKFEQSMMTCDEKELTIRGGKAICSGELRTGPGTVDLGPTGSYNKVRAGHLLIGGYPMGAAPKKKLKANKSYRFTVKVMDGFVLFYVGKELLGFNLLPGKRFQFGIAAYNSFVDINKVEINGKPDPEWVKKQLEK